MKSPRSPHQEKTADSTGDLFPSATSPIRYLMKVELRRANCAVSWCLCFPQQPMHLCIWQICFHIFSEGPASLRLFWARAQARASSLHTSQGAGSRYGRPGHPQRLPPRLAWAPWVTGRKFMSSWSWLLCAEGRNVNQGSHCVQAGRACGGLRRLRAAKLRPEPLVSQESLPGDHESGEKFIYSTKID